MTALLGIGLPDELLVTIFELASNNPTRDIHSLIRLHPFDSLREQNVDSRGKDALPTKLALSVVCKRFKRLMAKLLYEDLWVHHGTQGLLTSLLKSSKTSPECGYGTHTRRIVLPHSKAELTNEDCHELAANASRIIALCPNVRILSRSWRTVDELTGARLHSANANFPLPDGILCFPLLARVDWDNTTCIHLVNSPSSPEFLWDLESLEVMSLGGNCFPVKAAIEDASRRLISELQTPVHLPRLHTLRLHSEYVFGYPSGRQVALQLPALRRIVLERPSTLILLINGGYLWPFAPQIASVELGANISFLHADYVSAILQYYCPHATELFFPVFSTCSMTLNVFGVPENERRCYRVRHVGLHASLELERENLRSRFWWLMTIINNHFDVLCGEGTCFTSLERVTLYGEEWRHFVADDGFKPVLEMVSSRKVELVCEDEHVNMLLASGYRLELY